jgi:hypothetical protein
MPWNLYQNGKQSRKRGTLTGKKIGSKRPHDQNRETRQG